MKQEELRGHVKGYGNSELFKPVHCTLYQVSSGVEKYTYFPYTREQNIFQPFRLAAESSLSVRLV